MTSVSQCFKELNQKSQCALIPFITAGDPDLETTAKALKILDQNGADLIELGVPYSDPLADGPVIQAAATRALQKGVKLDDVLGLVKQVQGEVRSPIILFTYYNPIFYQGIETFLSQISAAGVKGLVVPDLPLEEAESFIQLAAARAIEVTLLVAPTSPLERIKAIAAKSEGFIYLVSVTGVTGMRSQVESRVQELLSSLRSVTDKPIGVGFGISEPEQALKIKQWGADAVIVGSAFVKRLATENPTAGLKSIGEFCHSLKQAISDYSS
jgi:tryptophan synthase alpha chain